MSLKAKNIPSTSTGPAQPAIEPGPYPARIAQIIDLGLQTRRAFEGKEKAPAHHIRITYELVDEFMVDEEGEVDEDKPRWVSESLAFFGLQADNANSTKRYLALDPDEVHEGDFAELAGAACSVNVVQKAGSGKNKDKIYNNVASITPPRKRDLDNFPELKNPPVVFTLDEPDFEVFNTLPTWLQDDIKGNLEYAGSALASMLDGGVSPEVAPQDSEDKPGDVEW